MTTIITSGNYPKALRPGMQKWWGRYYNEHPVEWTQLFDKETSDKSYEELGEATGFGLVPTKAAGAASAFDNDVQGTITRATHIAYSLGYGVTHEEMKDNLYMEVGKKRTSALAFSFRQTKEIVLANFYNRAFNSSYTFGDNKEMIATDHPTLSGDQSNELTVAADMSETSLEDMLIQIAGATNSRDLKFANLARCLIVPPSLQFTANRIVNSTLQNDTANNAINAINYMNMFPEGIKMNHYLTDTDAWFVRASVPSGSGLVMFQRENVSFDQDNDFSTKDALFRGYERYSATIADFRAIYGSPGA